MVEWNVHVCLYRFSTINSENSRAYTRRIFLKNTVMCCSNPSSMLLIGRRKIPFPLQLPQSEGYPVLHLHLANLCVYQVFFEASPQTPSPVLGYSTLWLNDVKVQRNGSFIFSGWFWKFWGNFGAPKGRRRWRSAHILEWNVRENPGKNVKMQVRRTNPASACMAPNLIPTLLQNILVWFGLPLAASMLRAHHSYARKPHILARAIRGLENDPQLYQLSIS